MAELVEIGESLLSHDTYGNPILSESDTEHFREVIAKIKKEWVK